MNFNDDHNMLGLLLALAAIAAAVIGVGRAGLVVAPVPSEAPFASAPTLEPLKLPVVSKTPTAKPLPAKAPLGAPAAAPKAAAAAAYAPPPVPKSDAAPAPR